MYYIYHPETFEYLKSVQRNTKKLPNVTKVDPHIPYWYDENEVYVFYPETEEWKKFKELREYKEDKKGKQVRTKFEGYLLPLEGDTETSTKRFNVKITDPLPYGAVVGRLPKIVDMIAEMREIYKKQYLVEINFILKTPFNENLVLKDGGYVPTMEFSLNLELLSRLARRDDYSYVSCELFAKKFGFYTDEKPIVQIGAQEILEDLDKTRLAYFKDNEWLDKAQTLPYRDVYERYVALMEEKKLYEKHS